MIVKSASLASILPSFDAEEVMTESIEEIEIMMFNKLLIRYGRLDEYITKKVGIQHFSIISKITGNPLFLHPTNVVNQESIHRIVPIKYFINQPSRVLLPHVIRTIAINNFYHPAHCAGIVDVYLTNSSHNSIHNPTNILIESIKNGYTPNLVWIFNTYHITGHTLVESDTLRTLYHSDHEEALRYMANRDSSILCRAVCGLHPIEYLCVQLENLIKSHDNASLSKWFDFIMAYISMSLTYFPRESGFIFVNAHMSVPIIMRIMKCHSKFAGSGTRSSRHGVQKVFDVFNAVDDPTGVFHHLLLFICPDFPLFVKYIRNKGSYTYYDNTGKPKTLMECFLERRLDVWVHHDLKDLDILYLIFRNWPESIIGIIKV